LTVPAEPSRPNEGSPNEVSPTKAPPIKVRLDDVHLSFVRPDRPVVRVLDGVSLEVPERCIYALIGPGAAGKSALLKLVAGLLKPDRGTIHIGAQRIDALDDLGLAEVRRDIGMLFQNYALFDFMTVGENIAFPLRRLYALPESEVAKRVAERLVRVALAGFEDRHPSSLSGGQKKRIGFARATVARPSLLLYDEPTAGLDPVTSRKIYDLVRDEQRADGATALVISSDVAGVLQIADRVGMLHDGKLIFDGTVQEARESEHPAVQQFVHGLTTGPL
jgi:phospholipid/cholesterol/gamma-HCH transport system ATP-binding protein